VIDRILYGAVADFLNMSCCGIDNPYAFNVADIAIFAGAIGLVFFAGKDRRWAAGRVPVPPADGALVGHAARYGVAPDIRNVLAQEDLAFRSENRGRILERLLNVNVYFRAYADQSLDQQAELRRWRRAGVRTVSAPPPQPGE
jgi:hypothetical protein